MIYSFTIGLCIWFIPFLYISGFENLLHVAFNQTVGHFRDFGGTIFSELDWYKNYLKGGAMKKAIVEGVRAGLTK